MIRKFLTWTTFALCVFATQFSFAESILIKAGHETVWKFWDKAQAPEPNWRNANFDDTEWASGSAPLGYGETDLGTTISFGSNSKAKTITAYFRSSFEIANPKELSELRFLIRSDDGIVVYLNGKEVIRNNLPQGKIAHTSTAIDVLDGVEERFYHRYKVEISTLIPGKNTVAVEVHQANAESSDLYLDLALTSYKIGEKLQPRLTPEAKKVGETYWNQHRVPPEMHIPDGYADGGRGMKLDADGYASSGREVLVVDRDHDAILRALIKFVQSRDVKNLPPLERAKLIGSRVVALGEFNNRDQDSEHAIAMMQDEYKNRAILIGDVATISGAGVCRHRSLLFKILGEEAGLSVALVRGNYGDSTGAHIWNELILEDGTKLVLDTMRWPRDILLPLTAAKKYLTVDNRPWYPESGPLAGSAKGSKNN